MRLFPALLLCAACSSLRSEILYQAREEGADVLPRGVHLASPPEKEELKRALDLWPWLEGPALKRRAWLLRCGVEPQRLSPTQAREAEELELMREKNCAQSAPRT